MPLRWRLLLFASAGRQCASSDPSRSSSPCLGRGVFDMLISSAGYPANASAPACAVPARTAVVLRGLLYAPEYHTSSSYSSREGAASGYTIDIRLTYPSVMAHVLERLRAAGGAVDVFLIAPEPSAELQEWVRSAMTPTRAWYFTAPSQFAYVSAGLRNVLARASVRNESYDRLYLLRADLLWGSDSFNVLTCNYKPRHINHAFYDILGKPVDTIFAVDWDEVDMLASALDGSGRDAHILWPRRWCNPLHPRRPKPRGCLRRSNAYAPNTPLHPQHGLLQGCFMRPNLCCNPLMEIQRNNRTEIQRCGPGVDANNRTRAPVKGNDPRGREMLCNPW
ncbi:hypothetical protein T492DRAFT_1019630 [Pavlovales sp. CCMP2436]|nr:hypothetical protein T492DRAFT_1019630 [Pavlovales sp. CCMP2436]